MKWPFVSRALYEDQVMRSIENTNRAIALYDALLGKYHDLVTTTKILPGSQPVEMPDRSPSLIDQVIREQAPTDPRLKAHLRNYASRLRRDGKSEGDIALALTEWSTTEPLSVD